jgi:uncharacterized protein YoxC
MEPKRPVGVEYLYGMLAVSCLVVFIQFATLVVYVTENRELKEKDRRAITDADRLLEALKSKGWKPSQ